MKWLSRLLFGAGLALAGSGCAQYLGSGVATVVYPFGVENGEGNVLHHARLLAGGRELYPAVGPAPWLVCNYPPLYSLLNAPFARSFAPLVSGRAISLLAMLWTGVMVFFVARSESGSNWIGALLALSLFCVPHVADVTVEYRVDMLAAALSLTGVFVLWRRGARAWPWAAAVFLAALYTKHSAIAAPVAACVWLAFSARPVKAPDWRTAGAFAATLGASGMALFVALDLWTRGEFHRHLIVYTRGEYSLRLAGLYLLTLIENTWPFAIGAALALSLRARPLPNGETRDPWRLFFVAAALTTLMAGRRGASLHYLLEVTPLFLILTARVAGRLRERLARERWAALVSAALALLLVFLAAGAPLRWRSHESERKAARLRDETICALMAAADGPILSEDISCIILSGREPDFHPFPMSSLWRAGRWDATDFVNAIRERRYALALLESPADNPNDFTRDRFTDEMLQAVASYPFRIQIGDRYLYCVRPLKIPDSQ